MGNKITSFAAQIWCKAECSAIFSKALSLHLIIFVIQSQCSVLVFFIIGTIGLTPGFALFGCTPTEVYLGGGLTLSPNVILLFPQVKDVPFAFHMPI